MAMDSGNPGQRPGGGTRESTPDDYSYDMAHEAVTATHPHPSAKASRTPAHGTMLPPSEEPDGDYSYDLAHDVPRTSNQR